MTDDTTSDGTDEQEAIERRLDRLETQLEAQQETIESQQARIDEQAAIIENQCEQLADDGDGDVLVNRRTALKTGGVLGLLGMGAGTASADPSGQIGTSSDSLNKLFTEELNGGVTGDTSLTDLAGSGLTISSGSLQTSGSSKWADGSSGGSWLEPSDSGDTKLEGIDTIESNDASSSLTITQDTNDDGTTNEGSVSALIPAGAQYQVKNSSDPNGFNILFEVRESTL